jgi:agmatinase
VKFIASNDNGKICIFGAPFDSTSSFRPGSRFAPQAIRDASYGLETYSIEQDYDLEDISFTDDGDLELPFGDPAPAIDIIEEKTSSCLLENKLPFLLGGEHLVTLGAFRAVYKLFPDTRVIHLDAHADLRDDYLGAKLSHATVIRRIADIIGLDRIRQIGIRSMTKEEAEPVKQIRASYKDAALWATDYPVYLTCDLDVLDPSVLPGTGTPEPGGMTFIELKDILIHLTSTLNIAAIDIVELSPQIDHSGNSSVVAAKLLRECLISLGKKQREVKHAGGQRTS